MKYSININQKAIIDLGLQDKVDFIDLAIYDFITEFMLCDECRKLNIDNVQYFWIKSDLIIENLPLLGITTTRGISKRIDKLIDCGLLERCNDNQNLHQSFFKVGKNYQAYKFFTWNENSKGAWNENSNNNNISNTKYSLDNNKLDYNKEEDIIISSKKNDYQSIIDCWNENNGKKLGKVTKITDKRKKAIKKALVDNGITQEQMMTFFKTLPYADKWLYNPNKQHANWKPDFDWWMANVNGWLTKALEGKVHLENPQAFSIIMLGKDAPYTPECGGALSWNDYYNTYIYVGMFYGHVSDGYTDDNRPNGAKIMLGNGGGFIVWNSETKTWDKVQS